MLPSQLRKCNIAVIQNIGLVVIVAIQMELQVTFLADIETRDQSSDGGNKHYPYSRLGSCLGKLQCSPSVAAQHEGPRALDGDDDLQALGGELVSLQPETNGELLEFLQGGKLNCKKKSDFKSKESQ